MTVMEAPIALARPRLADLLELTKPRITLLILVTAFLGFHLGSGHVLSLTLVPLLAGTALVSSGCSALNQFLERSADALMRRTEGRPLPAGRVRPLDALLFALALSASGLLILSTLVNLLTAALAAATLLSYAFAYTPLKRVTTLSTLVGAVPGALPPVGGWAAATGRLDVGAAILFAIVFLWQIPHFLAIASLYREDYIRGGMRMLPVAEPGERFTGMTVVLYTMALLPVSLLPAAAGLAGGLYLAGALILGFLFGHSALRFAWSRSQRNARRLLLASVAYLPLLWGLLLVDGVVRPALV
jgi:protoheme IX farnesyltransferase